VSEEEAQILDHLSAGKSGRRNSKRTARQHDRTVVEVDKGDDPQQWVI
jgi:hypothetical protein